MRRALCLLLTFLLACLLLGGCSEEDTAPATTPTVAEPQPTSEATEEVTIPETVETYPEARVNTVVLREDDADLRQEFLILAISQDGPFLAQDVKLNAKGADALVQWLMGEDCREMVEHFGVEAYGEPVFPSSGVEIHYGARIAKANANSAVIHLALDETLADTALLDNLIPVFEEAYGYTVEIQTGSTASALGTARNGYADLVLVQDGEQAQALMDDGFTRTVTGFADQSIPFVSMQYLLCGPEADPAGVKTAASVQTAFAAIAKQQATFISRGDGSYTHQLEQQFWPGNTEFGNWYISADMEMGPCLVMNDIQGGYILTDRLTWLIFTAANGII